MNKYSVIESTIIPFGKYSNKTFLDIYNKDQQYLKWLNTQPWFKIKFTSIHNLLNEFLEKYKEKIVINPDTIIIYTDGACKNNGSKSKYVSAGIGVHFSQDNYIQMEDISKKLDIDSPTNNKAELIAIKEALELCNKNKINEKIIVFTDSDYSIKAITLWYPNWVKSGDTEKKKNIDILRKIEPLYHKMNIKFQHIRAHTGLQDEHSIGNANADRLAVECLK